MGPRPTPWTRFEPTTTHSGWPHWGSHDLFTFERERLQPQLDAVRAQVEALADVRDVEGLRAGIEAVGVSFEQIFTDISETLDCS